jgi:hypothetical protein
VVEAPEGGGEAPVVVSWTSKVEEGQKSGSGFYAPITMRVKGLPDDIGDEYTINLGVGGDVSAPG